MRIFYVLQNMSDAFVIGNGISRIGIPLQKLHYKGKLYGCNALYREYTPDVLVSTDQPIAEHIQRSGYSKNNRFYTRKPIIGLGGEVVPYYKYSSGPNAVAIAIQDNHHQIYLVGFDMSGTEDKKFNNVYAGTEFYKPFDSIPTYPGNWENQLYEILEKNQNSNIIRVVGNTSLVETKMDKLKNYSIIEMSKFLNMINT